ncbi:MAG: NAD-dependent DNA ligase LigA [Flavobacteriales bacterium TMED191]|nr:MAG: NAD-dependent DNA ligase LigA [Flavobacteriales bacterium TMED191]|tara:strand:- start:55 stop:2157 length:2103 start_codon:yes stop_codon:yes gene_type:complete
MSIKERIEYLRNELNHHNYLYYILDKPRISDIEFDRLMSELATLENRYPNFSDPLSPTKRVGGNTVSTFKSVKHSFPMLSLDNTYTNSDLNKFDQKNKKLLSKDNLKYSCELKYDGVAISVIYKNGKLFQAITRGDGVFGDDVTENIKTIKSIPLKLFGEFPELLEMRGEIFIKKKQFEAINLNRLRQKEKLTKLFNNEIQSPISQDGRIKVEKKYNSDIKKLDPFSNPRNFASGSLKLLDSSKVAKRNLTCIFYSIHAEKLPFISHIENLRASKNWGFQIPEKFILANNISEVLNFVHQTELVRNSLPFEIDGIVIKVNNLNDQKILGHTAKSPRWAISFKFKAYQAYTILEDVKFQIGRTGSITPVAYFKPVAVAGSIIKRASLHNESFINNLDLKIGDRVIIEKGGDVIPKVVAVDKSKRDLLCQSIEFISHCPSCNSKLVKPINEANHYCFNSDNCMPQKINQIEHFISRDAMNISSLGTKTIELLFNEKIINCIQDLYKLKLDDFSNLKGFGVESNSFKKAQNIIDSIEKSKLESFEKVLFGLGIRHVGKTVSKKLVNSFKTIHNLLLAKKEKLLEIDEIGEKIADSLILFFQSYKNRIMIDELISYGLKFKILETQNESNLLLNLNFVITGTFQLSRKNLKLLIEKNGGFISSSLSKNTNFLVTGENFGPKKYEKAIDLNITMISESELLKMIK